MTPTYKYDLDLTVSIAEQHGGRLLTVDEVDRINRDWDAIQHVDMHLDRLVHEDADRPFNSPLPVSSDNLAALLLLADYMKRDALELESWADSIKRSACRLFHEQRDSLVSEKEQPETTRDAG